MKKSFTRSRQGSTNAKPGNAQAESAAQAHTAPGAETVLTLLNLDRARRRWRWWAVIALILLALTTCGRGCLEVLSAADKAAQGDHIAVLRLDGSEGEYIDTTWYQQQVLAALADDNATQAVVVYIDSPGGMIGGAMSLYQQLRTIAAAGKPVVAVIANLGASGGYLAALGADYIVANETSLVGSVGTLLPLADLTRLADKIGIQADEVVSGKMKTATSPLRTRTAAERLYLQDTVNDLNSMFIDKVKQRRKPTPEAMRLIAEARIFSGRTAKALGMVDALGNLPEAMAWLETQQVDPTLPLLEVSLVEELPWYEEFGAGVVAPLERVVGQVAPLTPALLAR